MLPSPLRRKTVQVPRTGGAKPEFKRRDPSRNKTNNDVVWRSKISSKRRMMNSGANAECFTTCRVNLCSDGTEGLPTVDLQ